MSENNVELPGGGSSFKVEKTVNFKISTLASRNPFGFNAKPITRSMAVLGLDLAMLSVLFFVFKALYSASEKTPEYLSNSLKDGLLLSDVKGGSWFHILGFTLCLCFMILSIILLFNPGIQRINFTLTLSVFIVIAVANIFAMNLIISDYHKSDTYDNWTHGRYGITVNDEGYLSNNSKAKLTMPDGRILRRVLKDDKENIIYQVLDKKDGNRIFLYDPRTNKELPLVNSNEVISNVGK